MLAAEQQDENWHDCDTSDLITKEVKRWLKSKLT